jgi:hypothetical protein
MNILLSWMALLSNRSVTSPACHLPYLVLVQPCVLPLPGAKSTVKLDAGDRLIIHTPGAGGWGKPEEGADALGAGQLQANIGHRGKEVQAMANGSSRASAGGLKRGRDEEHGQDEQKQQRQAPQTHIRRGSVHEYQARQEGA